MLERLNYLASAAQFDLCGNCGSPSKSPIDFIYRADLPGGGSLPVLKVLLTNVCINDCAYCVNQVATSKNCWKFNSAISYALLSSKCMLM